jgi:hypothetical protein
MNTFASRVQFSLSLLTERRLAMFIALDVLFVLPSVIVSVSGGNDVASEFYLPMFLIPAILIAVPMLGDTVAVERRSGTLDLAMTSPGANTYFERRVGAVAALLVAQGWIAVLINRLAGEPFPVSGPLLQMVIVACFIAAAALNWSVRMRTSGAVVFATYASILAFSPWFFSNPVHPPQFKGLGPMALPDYIEYFKANVILAAAALIFYLYARQRLSRPELIIT